MDNKKQQYFKEALSDFAIDVAAGGAIKSMALKGYTVSEIHSKLDFPISKEQISVLVWKYYLETGVILLKEPDPSKEEYRVTYEKVQDSYGKTSFRQLKEKVEYKGEYLPCDFGKRMYQDKAGFLKQIKQLSDRDQEYVLRLPWPLTTVWHKKDERITRIQEALQNNI